MEITLSDIPVVFQNPFTKCIEVMPLEMVTAYVPDFTFLLLEEAARVACVRDEDEANNLIASYQDCYSVSNPDGTGFDVPSVEPLSLR